jgi:hypothetical protein
MPNSLLRLFLSNSFRPFGALGIINNITRSILLSEWLMQAHKPK